MNVIFVCTGNTCRSPMAEGYFKDLCKKANKENISALSAGVSACPGIPVSQNSVNTLQKHGIDISSHVSSPLFPEMVEKADAIIAMTLSHKLQVARFHPEAVGKTHLLLEFSDKNGGDIGDPIGGPQSVYDQCFMQMKPALENLLLDLTSE